MKTTNLSLYVSELAKMLALSYDIRHPSRYLWLTLESLLISLFVPSNLSSLTLSLCCCFNLSYPLVLFLHFYLPCLHFALFWLALNLSDFFLLLGANFTFYLIQRKKKQQKKPLTCFCITCLTTIHLSSSHASCPLLSFPLLSRY